MTMQQLDDISTFRKADEFMRILRSAVGKAQERSRRLGVASVYSFNGRRYFELPSGEITQTRPENGDVKRN
jgi:hypothetical protein